MNADFIMTETEVNHLRKLAKIQLGYSKLPIMEERRENWYKHNALQGEKPMIVMEMSSFSKELLPPLQCEHVFAQELEFELLMNIINHEQIDDDKVIPNFINVKYKINMKELNVDCQIHRATDSKGRNIGYSMDHPIVDLEEDFYKLEKSVYSYDEAYTNKRVEVANEVLGDILKVRLYNDSLHWFVSLTARCVNVMGLEALMYAMIDCPEKTHELFDFITEDAIEYMKWQEELGLLLLNNGNHYTGAGSFGFTNELPTEECKKTGRVKLKDLWVNMNSQESVGISPEMYEEFVFPSFAKIAKLFGLVYYGCCEPVHDIWDTCISKIDHLRKVSISAWCDEEIMGKALRNSNVIYSRKPFPNYIGVGKFDEQAFREHITITLKAAKGCHLEIIFRDIYSLTGELDKAKRAVLIVRELIEEIW